MNTGPVLLLKLSTIFIKEIIYIQYGIFLIELYIFW